MSRKQAQDVERDYYEFRRQMAEKRRAAQRSAASTAQANIPQPRPQRTGFSDTDSTAPVQPAKPAPKPASRSASVKPQPPIREKHPLPVEPVAEATEAAEAVVQQPVIEQPAPAPAPVEPEIELEAADAPVVEEAVPLESEPAQDALPEAADEEDGYEDYEDDEGDYEEDEESEESASSFSTLLKGVGTKFGALSDRLKALTHRSNIEETADEEDDYDSAADGKSGEPAESPATEVVDEALPDSADEAPADELPADSIESSEADVESAETPAPAAPTVDLTNDSADATPDDESDDEDMVDIAAAPAEPAAVHLQIIDEEAASDESGDDYEDDEDEDDEDDKDDEPSALNRLLSRVHGLFARRANRADTDEEDDEEEETEEADDEDEALPSDDEAEDEAPEKTPQTDDEEDDDLYDENASDEDWSQFIEDDGDDDLSTPAAHNASDAQDMEGEQSTMDNKQKSMTELMAEGMSETPSLSRRERRMLNEAAGTKTPAKEAAPALSDDSAEVEEPTVEYKPVRTRPPKKAPVVLDDDDNEDEDDEEEEVKKPSKAARKKAKRPVYDDDEDEDDEDEDDEDEDDEDIDDEDDDEDDISVSKRIFGFIRALLAIVLVFILLVITLRVGEAGGYFKLGWLRDSLGSRVSFVNTLFPEPADSTTSAIPNVQ